MRYQELRQLEKRLYFTVDDLMGVSGLKRGSAHVLANRYVKKGIFLRLKNNFYVAAQRWDSLSQEDFFKISNLLQVPSYLSFATALSLQGVSTQVQRGVFESACLRRSKKIPAAGVSFNYYKVNKKYYFGFSKKDNIFVAAKEKALADTLYLCSFGKYKLDFAALDLGKIDRQQLKKILKVYPEKTRVMAEKLYARTDKAGKI